MDSFCKESGKRCYTKVEANSFVNLHKNRKLRSYHCDFCNHYHLTSQPKRTSADYSVKSQPLKRAKEFAKFLKKD